MSEESIQTAEKRKRSLVSSVSDADESINKSPAEQTDNTEVEETLSRRQKKNRGKKAKTDIQPGEKQRNIQEMFGALQKDQEKTQKENPPKESKELETKKDDSKEKMLEKRLNAISDKLDQLARKDDKAFLKELIKEVFEEIKGTYLSSVQHQIEVVEGDLHEQIVENGKLTAKIETLQDEIEKKTSEIEKLKSTHEKEKQLVTEKFNDQEQYTRKNSIRLTSLPDDVENESPMETAEKVVNTLNEHLWLGITVRDIDITHRLGVFDASKRKGRAVIVKFVQRTAKQVVLKNKRWLKGTGIAAYEDLTRLNSQVLASTRKKAPEQVKDSWSRDGKIFIKRTDTGAVERVKFADFNKWLAMPWPVDPKTSSSRGAPTASS